MIVTLIADNYFGYCKKEVKTQISYAANLYGNVEEEHAGGAIVFPSYNLGEEFHADARFGNGRTLADVVRDYPQFIDARPEGYAVDRNFPDLIYIAGNAKAEPARSKAHLGEGRRRAVELPLLPGKVYMTPSGYKVRMEKHPGSTTWRLIGTAAEGAFCHKPCTVSGGGKSEISKSLVDYMLFGPIFVADPEKDFKLVDEIFDKDYSARYRPDAAERPDYDQSPEPQDPRPRADAGQRDQAAHAVAAVHRRIQRLAAVDSQLHLRAWCSSSSVFNRRNGTAAGASISAWTSSTARRATS